MSSGLSLLPLGCCIMQMSWIWSSSCFASALSNKHSSSCAWLCPGAPAHVGSRPVAHVQQTLEPHTCSVLHFRFGRILLRWAPVWDEYARQGSRAEEALTLLSAEVCCGAQRLVSRSAMRCWPAARAASSCCGAPTASEARHCDHAAPAP